jgi:hypothetical protein
MKTQLNQERRQIFLEELAMSFQRNTRIDSEVDRETIARNIGNMWLEAQIKAGAKIKWTNIFEACFDKQNAENNAGKRKTLILLDGEQSPKSLQPQAHGRNYFLIGLELSKRLLNADTSSEQIIRFTVQRLIEGTSLETSQSYEERFNQKFLLDVEKVLRKVTKDIRHELDLDWLLMMRNKRKLTHESGEKISWGLFEDHPDDKPLACINLGYVSEDVSAGFTAIDFLAVPSDEENVIRNIREAITKSPFPITFDNGVFMDSDGVVEQTLKGEKVHDYFEFPLTVAQLKREISLELRLDTASETWNIAIKNFFQENLDLRYVDRIHVGQVITSPFSLPSGEIVKPLIADVLAYKNNIQLSSFGDFFGEKNDPETSESDFYEIEIVAPWSPHEEWNLWDQMGANEIGNIYSTMKVPGYAGFDEAVAQQIVANPDLIQDASEYLTSAPLGSIADLILRNITLADSDKRIDRLLINKANKVINPLHNEERKRLSHYEDRLENYLTGGK